MSEFYTPLLLPPALVQAQHTFGFALLRQITQATPQTNVFLSPFSITMALLLALEGSAGATHEAIANTLQVGQIPPDKLLAAVARQVAAITQQEPDQPIFCVANSLWASKGFALAPAYAARLQQQYRAEAVTLDFTALSAADTINAWVSRHTQGRITNMVAASDFTQQTALLLINAVYFKGSWETAFNAANTQPGPFMLANGTQQLVSLMRQRSEQIGYQKGTGWQAVQLHYSGHPRSASMQLFIPDAPTGLPGFLAGLTTEKWGQWQANFAQHTGDLEVDLTLPRFRLEWEQDLSTALCNMGLGPALDPGADFTPMGFSSESPGSISQITHKTYLNVDEQGTEAAGVTAIMVWMAGGGPATPPRRVTVRADRPFFCAIVDNETGTILFSGAVYQPAT